MTSERGDGGGNWLGAADFEPVHPSSALPLGLVGDWRTIAVFQPAVFPWQIHSKQPIIEKSDEQRL
jgi:hypothetical protein